MAELLRLEGVAAGYGDSVVLDDVSLALGEGDSLALLGRNGMGKSTLLVTLMGLTRLHRGAILLRGADLTRLATHQRARAGLGWVPQERLVFPSLTVEEHLTAVARPGPFTVEAAYGIFPRLAERRGNMGNQLSGGEQQMLAIGRALLSNPDLLVLDEPSEGLAPVIVDQVAEILCRLRDEGTALLLIEQHLSLIERVARSCHVMSKGRIVGGGPLDRSTVGELRRHIAI